MGVKECWAVGVKYLTKGIVIQRDCREHCKNSMMKPGYEWAV